MNNGWIKIYRKLKDKGYYRKSEYVHLWVHLLMEANHDHKELLFNGSIINLKPGQFVTGRNKLSEETGINRSKIDRIMKVFENEHQIEQQMTNKFRLITIQNWNDYQKSEQQSEPQVSIKRASSEHQVSTNKNVRSKECKKKTVVIPDHLCDIWKHFVEMRQKIRKPLTDKATQLTLKKLENLSTDKEIQIAILEQSVQNSWQGVFTLKDTLATKAPIHHSTGEQLTEREIFMRDNWSKPNLTELLEERFGK